MKAGWIASSSSRHSPWIRGSTIIKNWPKFKIEIVPRQIPSSIRGLPNRFLFVPQNHHTRTRGTSISGTTHCTDTVLHPPHTHTRACTRSKRTAHTDVFHNNSPIVCLLIDFLNGFLPEFFWCSSSRRSGIRTHCTAIEPPCTCSKRRSCTTRN